MEHIHRELTINSSLDELVRVREFIENVCSEFTGLSYGKFVDELKLAVHEATINIMKHAYGEGPLKNILIEARASAGNLSIRLLHHGRSFDPETAPVPVFDGSKDSGFGLYIIEHFVDNVEYRNDESGKSIILQKSLKS